MAKEIAARKTDRPREAQSRDNQLYCAMPPARPIEIPANIAADRASAIITFGKKWSNGTRLRYYFFTDAARDGEVVTLVDGTQEWRTYVGAEPQRRVVRDAFARWKSLGIGLEFEETTDRSEAEIRIGFMQGDGSWSALGRDVLGYGQDERTMNFGWNLIGDIDTAVHEIGHTLGLPHEHQNPNAGIVWNEEAVYASFAGYPNFWSRDKTHYNIIRKLETSEVQGSSWDPNSIMHYAFREGMISSPADYRGGLTPAGGLSPRDITWIKTFYPPLPAEQRALEPGLSRPLEVAPGEQANFVFEPAATRKYKVQTFGACDTQIVMFEQVDGSWRYLAADDDSGEDRNALIDVRLRQGRRYAVRVRLNYASGGSPPAVMIW